MILRMKRTSLGLPMLLALGLLLPGSLQAQRRGRSAPQPSGAWAPAVVGVHVGYDDVSNGNILGAQLRLPILRSGTVEIVPSGNITFVTGLKEYQFNLDATYTLGGGTRGLYVGGGLAIRNTVFDGPDRESKTGYGIVGGVKTGGAGAPVGLQIEVRKMWVDSRLNPRVLTFGLNVPLWGRGQP